MKAVKIHLIDSTPEEVAEAIKEGEDILLASDGIGNRVYLKYDPNYEEEEERHSGWYLDIGDDTYSESEVLYESDIEDPAGLLDDAHKIVHDWLEKNRDIYDSFVHEYAEWVSGDYGLELYYVPCVICADCGKEIIKREEAGYYREPTEKESESWGYSFPHLVFLSSDYKEAREMLYGESELREEIAIAALEEGEELIRTPSGKGVAHTTDAIIVHLPAEVSPDEEEHYFFVETDVSAYGNVLGQGWRTKLWEITSGEARLAVSKNNAWEAEPSMEAEEYWVL